MLKITVIVRAIANPIPGLSLPSIKTIAETKAKVIPATKMMVTAEARVRLPPTLAKARVIPMPEVRSG